MKFAPLSGEYKKQAEDGENGYTGTTEQCAERKYV